jgi:hypothetical protein
MNGLPRVELTLHPDIAALPGIRSATDAAVTDLEELRDSLGNSRDVLLTVRVGAPTAWADIAIEGALVPQPRVLLHRAAAVADPAAAVTVDGVDEVRQFIAALARKPSPADAIARWMRTIVHGVVLLALKRPLVGSTLADPALHLAEPDAAELAVIAGSTGTSLAAILDGASIRQGLPVRAVNLVVDPAIPLGCFRWRFGGVPMPLAGVLGAGTARVRSELMQPPANGEAFAMGAIDVLARTTDQDLRWCGELLLDDHAVNELLDTLAWEAAPDLVAAARALVPAGNIAQILRQLAAEQVPLVDLLPVVERLVDATLAGCPSEQLVDCIRQGLPRHIALAAGAQNGRLYVWELAPAFAARCASPGHVLRHEPTVRSHEVIDQAMGTATPRAVLVTGEIRAAAAQALRKQAPGIVVVSEQELPGTVEVVSAGVLPDDSG